MTPNLHIEGVPINLGVRRPFGDLEWSTLADGGCGDITWSMQLPVGFTHPLLRRGKLVQVCAGSANLCAGIMSQPDVSVDDDGTPTWTFTAAGLKSQGTKMLAFDGSGNTCAVPDAAVDAAIARGLRWKRPSSLSAVAVTDDGSGETDALNKLGDLLDEAAKQLNKRWGVDADGNAYMRADPTTPTLYATGQAGRFGLADDDYASGVFLRYLNPAGKYVTASAEDEAAGDQYGPSEVGQDGTSLGALSSTKANARVADALAKGAARLGWTAPITPNRWQLTTPGGTPVPWWLVKGGQMVRLVDVIDEQGNPLPYVDVVIGEAHCSANDQAVTISPVGLVPRDTTSVIAAAVGLAS